MAVDLSLSILIVDDYKTMLRIIRNLLKQLGFHNVDEATDGAEALNKLRGKSYDLVISDWNMEPMTGYELLKEVLSDDMLKSLSFIMVTAESKTDNVINDVDDINEKDLLNGPSLLGEKIDQNEVDDLMDFSSQNETVIVEDSDETVAIDGMDDSKDESGIASSLDGNNSGSCDEDSQTEDTEFEFVMDEENEKDTLDIFDKMPEDDLADTNITALNGNRSSKRSEQTEDKKAPKTSANDLLETSQDDIDHLFA